MSLQDYITIFKGLTHHSDVRKHHSKTITSLVWGLRSKIKCAMISGSYDLDTVEEAFDVALKIDLTFKVLVNDLDVLIVWDMNIMIISTPQRVNMLELCLLILMTQRLLRMSKFFPRL